MQSEFSISVDMISASWPAVILGLVPPHAKLNYTANSKNILHHLKMGS
jgi:hypothetical protein